MKLSSVCIFSLLASMLWAQSSAPPVSFSISPNPANVKVNEEWTTTITYSDADTDENGRQVWHTGYIYVQIYQINSGSTLSWVLSSTGPTSTYLHVKRAKGTQGQYIDYYRYGDSHPLSYYNDTGGAWITVGQIVNVGPDTEPPGGG
jgi:hypothetical protein